MYRHPSKEVLARLDSLGIRNYKTSEMGSVRVEFSEGKMHIFANSSGLF